MANKKKHKDHPKQLVSISLRYGGSVVYVTSLSRRDALMDIKMAIRVALRGEDHFIPIVCEQATDGVTEVLASEIIAIGCTTASTTANSKTPQGNA